MANYRIVCEECTALLDEAVSEGFLGGTAYQKCDRCVRSTLLKNPYLDSAINLEKEFSQEAHNQDRVRAVRDFGLNCLQRGYDLGLKDGARNSDDQ